VRAARGRDRATAAVTVSLTAARAAGVVTTSLDVV
jgi:hypothetical protein